MYLIFPTIYTPLLPTVRALLSFQTGFPVLVVVKEVLNALEGRNCTTPSSSKTNNSKQKIEKVHTCILWTNFKTNYHTPCKDPWIEMRCFSLVWWSEKERVWSFSLLIIALYKGIPPAMIIECPHQFVAKNLIPRWIISWYI